jgi:uncharacterized protein
VFSPLQLVVAWLVTFVGAAVQGTVGFGYGVFSVPILTLIDSRFTPIPQLLLVIPITIGAVLRERQHLDFAGLGWISIGRVPGSILGAWVITVLSRRLVDGIIALIVLTMVLIVAGGFHLSRNPLNSALAGFASGFGGTTSAIGGPPLALLYRGASGETIRSSLGAIFFMGAIINLSSLLVVGAITRDDLQVAVLLAPALLAGLAVSIPISRRVDARMLRTAILIISSIAAAALAVKTVLG